MKRRSVLLLFSLLVSAFILTGCQLIHQTGTQNSTATSKTSKQNSSEVYYTDLSKADRAKFNFAFKATEDSAGAPNPSEEDTIRMAVTNHTNRIVQFDRSKFMIFQDAEHKKVSKLTGLLTVKPGETRKITEIFDHVNDQFLVSSGIFLYLNQHYPLAYTYYAFRKDGVTSANLKDKKLIKINTPHQESQSSSASSDDSNDTADCDDSTNDADQNQDSGDQSNAGQSVANNNSSASTTMTEAQAETILRNWFASDTGVTFDQTFADGVQISQGTAAWGFTDSNGESWDVFYDGHIKGPGDPQ